jgi:hypothetical protein
MIGSWFGGNHWQLVGPMIMQWSFFCEPKHKLVCAIHSLRSAQPTPDSMLSFLVGDVIDRRIRVIPSNMVLEGAYVLPTVRNVNDTFPNSVDKADYFVVIPPWSTWMEAGLQMIEDYIDNWSVVVITSYCFILSLWIAQVYWGIPCPIMIQCQERESSLSSL